VRWPSGPHRIRKIGLPEGGGRAATRKEGERIMKILAALMAVAAILSASSLWAAGAPAIPDGPYKEYYDNGKVRAEGTARNGQRDGPWTFYSPTGQFLFRTEYKDGQHVPAPARTLKDERCGFTVTIPPGYEEYPAGKVSAMVLYAFINAWETDGVSTAISIDDLGGTIGPEQPLESAVMKGMDEATKGDTSKKLSEITGKDVPLSADAPKFTQLPWGTFSVWRMTSHLKAGDQEILVNGVQIPLRPKAIQVLVAADPSQEKESEATLDAVLATLHGEAGYDASSDEALGRAVGEAVGAGALVVVVLYLVHRANKKRAAAAASAADEPPMVR
jgi:hypothetical protein